MFDFSEDVDLISEHSSENSLDREVNKKLKLMVELGEHEPDKVKEQDIMPLE